MNLLAGLASAAFAFVFMMAMTTLVMEKEMNLALFYALLAAVMMFFVFGFMARNVTANIDGATPGKAADVIAAKFKIERAALPGGGLRLTAGANFFWTPVDIVPTVTGVTLRGPANIIAFMKAQLAKA